MNIPDSGWLVLLRKAEWWLVAAVAATAAVVLTLAQFKVSWFANLPTMVVTGTAIVGVLAFFLLVFRWIDQAWRAFRKRRASKVRRGANELSQRQFGFLMTTFAGGSRNFQLSGDHGSPRWLEELKRWNYIEKNLVWVWTPGSPDYFLITEAGWRELEKWQRRSAKTLLAP